MKNKIGFLLIPCYLAFFILSWVILFRDGRALYTFVYFYGHRDIADSITLILQKFGLNLVPTILFAAFGLVAFYLYFKSLRQKINIRQTIIFSIIFQAITFFSYPILSRDIFYYIFSDRVARIYHQNIWKVTTDKFAFDPFGHWTDWQHQVKIYGGINQLVYNLASQISGDSLIRSLIVYKSVALIFFIASIFIVYKIAKIKLPGKESWALRFIFWNPLFLLEIVGAAHNDILMIFFLLLSLFFYLRKQALMLGLSLAIAVSIKFIAIILFPFLFVELLKQKNLKNLIGFSLSFILVNIAVFKYMDVSPIYFGKKLLENTNIYWQSLPSLIYRVYPHKNLIFPTLFLIANLVFLIFGFLKKINPFYLYMISVFTYLVFFSGAYWNWYVLWIFIFVPFLGRNRLSIPIQILTFTSLLAYPLYWLSLRFDYQNMIWQLIFYVFILGIPLMFLFKKGWKFYYLNFPEDNHKTEKSKRRQAK